jgi:hypothetical protein
VASIASVMTIAATSSRHPYFTRIAFLLKNSEPVERRAARIIGVMPNALKRVAEVGRVGNYSSIVTKTLRDAHEGAKFVNRIDNNVVVHMPTLIQKHC